MATNRMRCTRCGKTLSSSSMTCAYCSGPHSTRARGATKQAVAAGPPAQTAAVPGSSSPTHLDCERLSLGTRHRLLRNLASSRKAGVRDPELLYAGARYAASLGLADECCRFLDPLSEMFTADDGKTQGFVPVALLYLYALPPGEKRESVERQLEPLLAGDPSALIARPAPGIPEDDTPAKTHD